VRPVGSGRAAALPRPRRRSRRSKTIGQVGHGRVGTRAEHLVSDLPGERHAVVDALRARTLEEVGRVHGEPTGELGIRIERVMTDNAKGYVESRAFQAALISIGATRKRTRSYRAQTNGKAEAFIWTLQREWAYAGPYSSNATRRPAPAHFVDTYNRRRPDAEISVKISLSLGVWNGYT
jgi:transposase InsO family protein